MLCNQLLIIIDFTKHITQVLFIGIRNNKKIKGSKSIWDKNRKRFILTKISEIGEPSPQFGATSDEHYIFAI